MTTEIRLQELCTINNHISVECDKMMQYLQIIKEKSEYAIKFLNSLNTTNFLRRYSVTYEYLNKFHIKLLDQNCLFELFFLELEEPSSNDMLTTNPSVRDLSVESGILDAWTNTFSETQESRKHVFNHTTSLNKEQNNACLSKMSGITRTRIKNISPVASENSMNVEAKEFFPKNSSSSTDVVIETSSTTSKSDIVEAIEITKNHSSNAPNSAEVLSRLSEENVAQHNLRSMKSLEITINNKHNQRLVKENAPKNNFHKEKSSTNNLYNVSPAISEAARTKGIQEEMKDDENVIDFKIRDVIKQMNDKMRANELKNSVVIPDLRPTVVRNDTDTSSSALSFPPEKSSPKHSKTVKKKINHSKTELPNDSIHLQIVAKKGPIPKEGELCFISSIESPSSFYIHAIRDDNTLIDSLSQQIAEISHSLKAFHSKREARKYINIYCICYINAHAAWCRVEVTNWMMVDDQMIEVRLIDYGLTCKVPLRNIREPNQYFFVLPTMADKCELAWVKPLNNREEWSLESSEYFKKITEADRLFTISYVEEIGDRLIVDLQNNIIQSVAGMMISDGKAVDDNGSDDNSRKSVTEFNNFMKKQIIKSQGFDEEELNQAEEDRLKSLMFDEEDDEEVTNPNLAVSHYNPHDERDICRIFLANGHCSKKHCTFSHKPLNPDGWTTDREAVYYDAFNQLQLPQPGAEITVKIVNIVDLRTFYVVVKNLPECTNLIGMPVYNIRTLVKLMNDPTEVKSYKTFTAIAGLGEIILVKYENNWQRGRVVGIDDYAYKVDLDILLVDFGLIQKFNMKNCRKISEKHLHLPFQVVLCTLCNVKMKDNITESENEMGNDYLEMNVENKKLKAKIMHSSHYLNVHLYTENGQDIGEELIKAEIVNRCSKSFTSKSEYGLVD